MKWIGPADFGGGIVELEFGHVFEELSDEEIYPLLQDRKTCKEAALDLIDAAKKNGGSDNITVVIVEE